MLVGGGRLISLELLFTSALPDLEGSETLPVPANDSIGLYDDERVPPAAPDAGKDNP